MYLEAELDAQAPKPAPRRPKEKQLRRKHSLRRLGAQQQCQHLKTPFWRLGAQTATSLMPRRPAALQ
ncbi:hypothetical protein PIB30_115293, partial [Stylosanthes scabra]|nr:hypothetical protein [Stylosanthes scabra]